MAALPVLLAAEIAVGPEIGLFVVETLELALLAAGMPAVERLAAELPAFGPLAFVPPVVALLSAGLEH